MSKSEPDMEKGPKSTNSSDISRLRENEVSVGNFPIEPVYRLRKRGEKYVNEEVKRMENSGQWEGIRTRQALDENGNIILEEREIIATPIIDR